MSAKDGGAAFPVVQQVNAEKGMWATAPAPHLGMSLRDHFAGQALWVVDTIADRLAASNEPGMYEANAQHEYIVPPDVVAARIAKAAYMIADAMIAEQQKRGAS